jgi:hypothetical protein
MPTTVFALTQAAGTPLLNVPDLFCSLNHALPPQEKPKLEGGACFYIDGTAGRLLSGGLRAQ